MREVQPVDAGGRLTIWRSSDGLRPPLEPLRFMIPRTIKDRLGNHPSRILQTGLYKLAFLRFRYYCRRDETPRDAGASPGDAYRAADPRRRPRD